MMKKLQLGPKTSDVFVVIYLLGTLFVRFILEPQLNGHIIASLGLGLFALLMLWAFVKSGWLQPTWFGLLDKK